MMLRSFGIVGSAIALWPSSGWAKPDPGSICRLLAREMREMHMSAEACKAHFHRAAAPPGSYIGTPGNDKFVGTFFSDDFEMSQGGNDTVKGRAENDYFHFGGAFTGRDHIDGGSQTFRDVLDLYGDYSSGVTFGPKTLVNVEEIDLYGSFADGGQNYKLTLDDATVASGKFLYVYLWDQLRENDFLDLDATRETNGDIYVQDLAAATDHIVMGGGNDYVGSGRVINDVVDGGGGWNVINLYAAGTSLNVSLYLQGTPQDIGNGHILTLDHFQGLKGSFNTDTLIGDDNDNFIDSNGGDDNIQGNGGNDLIWIDDDYTAMTVDGGSGNNTLSFEVSYGSGATFSLALQGTAQATGQGGTVNATKFVDLVGADMFNDTLSGNSAANRIFGGGGDDLLNGNDGNDSLYGDAIYGKRFTDSAHIGMSGFKIRSSGNGKDSLNGGAGNDSLIGGLGADMLTGGSGTDTFILQALGDALPGSGYRDIIADFSQQQGDKIDLHAIDADTTKKGNQAFQLGGSAFTGTAGELIQFSGGSGNTIVAGDVNGDSVADMEIELPQAITLAATDFAL